MPFLVVIAKRIREEITQPNLKENIAFTRSSRPDSREGLGWLHTERAPAEDLTGSTDLGVLPHATIEDELPLTSSQLP